MRGVSFGGKGAPMKVPSVPLPNLAEKTTVDHLEDVCARPIEGAARESDAEPGPEP